MEELVKKLRADLQEARNNTARMGIAMMQAQEGFEAAKIEIVDLQEEVEDLKDTVVSLEDEIVRGLSGETY